MSKHTFNTFKENLKNMDNNERKETLKQLQATLMYETTQNFGMGQSGREATIWVLRKKIAICKTAMKCWR